MSEHQQLSITSLIDPETELAVLHALMVYRTAESGMALVKAKEAYFYDEWNAQFLTMLKDMERRGFSLDVAEVKAKMLQEYPHLKEAMTKILYSEPMPAVAFGVEILQEWYKKRQLYLGLVAGMQELTSGQGALSCASEVEKHIDLILTQEEGGTPSFAELNAQYANEPAVGKVPTGISFLDIKSGGGHNKQGGMNLGSLIGLLGDEDAGKTTFGVQILRNVTKRGIKVLFFPLEFGSRTFWENTLKKEHDFNHELFLVEDRYTDIYDIEAKIKEQALAGVKVVLLDSQMVIEVGKPFPNESKMEGEKFRVLQRLAIRLEIIIIFVCQRNNSHTATNVIVPYGSTHAKHFLHEIWFIKKNNLSFNDDGEEEKKGMREFMRTKSKSGGYFSKPMKLDTRYMEFRGVQYDDDDPRSTRTVGSGRPKKKEPTVFVYEDKDGKEETLGAFDSLAEMPPI